jgi:hypothetical protein
MAEGRWGYAVPLRRRTYVVTASPCSSWPPWSVPEAEATQGGELRLDSVQPLGVQEPAILSLFCGQSTVDIGSVTCGSDLPQRIDTVFTSRTGGHDIASALRLLTTAGHNLDLGLRTSWDSQGSAQQSDPVARCSLHKGITRISPSLSRLTGLDAIRH